MALAIPILAAKCLPCHNAELKTSGLDLSTRQAAIVGGAHGAALVPRDAEASRIYQHVAAGKMPPGKKLAADEVTAIRDWIANGAAWEQAVERQEWWAFRTPERPAVPRVNGTQHPIDAFLSEKLGAKGLGFARQADARTLIRRLHFTLTGLPPRPEDLDRPFDQAVDHLLASPQYAERWARHWLDIVRYGETDGGEHNNERFTAWKYRDYVIDAFHNDKPYDQFVREQVAGDAIDAANPRLVAATGFLVAGPWDSVTKKINRDEMFRRTIRQDELDDFVTTTFATFQALTVGCARCHDHKFDPIPTRDYYRLTAAFHGITYGERSVYTEQQKKDYDALTAPFRKQLAQLTQDLDRIEDPVRARLLKASYEAEAARPRLKRLPVNPITNENRFAAVEAKRARLVITANQGKAAPRLDRFELLPGGPVITDWQGSKAASDDAPQMLELTVDSGKVDGIRWSSDGETGKSDGSLKVYRLEVSTDGAAWRTVASSIDHDSASEFLLPTVDYDELARAIPDTQRDRHAKLRAERKRVQRELDRIPKLESVHAAYLEPEMLPAHLLDRGSVAKPLEEVTPGALSVIRQLSPDFGKGSDAERRLALSRWLSDGRNPLTARVMVNRVWQYHFGQGLVNTPSDFGVNGDRPSHPELLDWLAVEFMENGWSLKWLHRQILATRAWRQSSESNEAAHGVDAANRLLWHMPLKRMDAETLRDSILFAAGSLNPERGGPSVSFHTPKQPGSYLYFRLDESDPQLWRRSVYRFVIRGAQRTFMDSFDCPDPAVATPQRSVSNTPVQALTLLNNDFVLHQAGRLAERIDREQPASPVDRAYQLLFQRAPTAQESALARQFLASNTLAHYCRVLLNTNEFVYVP